MRALFVLGLLIAALTVDARREATAQWCAYYDPYTYTCGFVSFNQCLATVTGAGGFCRQDSYQRAPRADDRRSPPPSQGERPRRDRY